MKKHIALIGYRGCGKTSVGRKLSRVMKLPWVDTDQMIEARSGLKISELFPRFGEEHFRELESEALATAVSGPSQIIATGGGIVDNEKNRQLIKNHCFVVWLTAPIDTIYERINQDHSRPALTALAPMDEIRFVLEKREPLYSRLADLVCDTKNQPFSKIVELIAKNSDKLIGFGD